MLQLAAMLLAYLVPTTEADLTSFDRLHFSGDIETRRIILILCW
jgi:hypothetical protein